MRFLRDKLREKESIIEDLKRKMQEYQETERTKMVCFSKKRKDYKFITKPRNL